MLTRAGIRLLDAPDANLFDMVKEGETVRIVGDEIVLSDEQVLRGRLLGAAELESQLAEQRDRIDEALAEFAENTVAHVRQETDLLTGEIAFPPTRAKFRDRHVLI